MIRNITHVNRLEACYGPGPMRVNDANAVLTAAEAENGILCRRFKDKDSLAEAAAASWALLAMRDPKGYDGLSEQYRYYSGILEAAGFSLDEADIKDARDSAGLSERIRSGLRLKDPEIARAHVDDLQDGVARDACGRMLAANGRPEIFAMLPPGAYAHALDRDNERVRQKRIEALSWDDGKPGTAGKSRLERMTALDRLKSMLRCSGMDPDTKERGGTECLP